MQAQLFIFATETTQSSQVDQKIQQSRSRWVCYKAYYSLFQILNVVEAYNLGIKDSIILIWSTQSLFGKYILPVPYQGSYYYNI